MIIAKIIRNAPPEIMYRFFSLINLFKFTILSSFLSYNVMTLAIVLIVLEHCVSFPYLEAAVI